MIRHFPFTRLHNFRDLGGYQADDGRTVRWGRLYRSNSLGKLADDDLERFQALGVRTVIDLRYPWEIAARGRAPESPALTWLNLSIEHRTYDQAEIDPDVDPWRYLADRYAEVAADGVAELRQALDVIAEGDHPLVFHCASGKDRTGPARRPGAGAGRRGRGPDRRGLRPPSSPPTGGPPIPAVRCAGPGTDARRRKSSGCSWPT